MREEQRFDVCASALAHERYMGRWSRLVAPGYVAALSPADGDRLRDALAASVPRLPDDSVALTARAWAVRGREPGPEGGA